MNVISAIETYINKMTTEVKGMKVLLLDKETTSIISASFTQSQLLEKEIYLIDPIDNQRREKMKHLKCIVFIRPSLNSIGLLTREISEPSFGEYHIYFSNTVHKSQIERLAESDCHEVIREVQEFFADYVAINQDLFSLNLSSNLFIESPKTWDTPSLTRCTEGVIAVLLSLKKKPLIRYEANSTLARKLAAEVSYSIQNEGPLFDFRKPDTPPILLIMDRRNDAVTPLLNQWSYQAMIHELIGITNGRVDLSNVKDVRDEIREIVLNGQDGFFKDNMYLNLGELGENIKKYVDEFQAKHNSTKKIESVSDMKRFVEDYPEFRKLSGFVTKHVALVGELSRRVSTDKLLEVGELEQSLATANNHSTDSKAVENFLRMAGLSTQMKTRLVLLYALRYEKSNGANVKAYIDTLKVESESHAKLVEKVLVYASSEPKLDQVEDFIARTKNNVIKGMKGVENIFQQHTPRLNSILSEMIKGKLNPTIFPFFEGSTKDRPQDVIVFMIGGSTYSESYEVAKLNGAGTRIIMGGTCIHNSQSFLQEVERSVNCWNNLGKEGLVQKIEGVDRSARMQNKMSTVSLKDLLRKRVMDDMIKAVQPAAKWKLLVVDANSAKLLNTIVKSHEILQENVTALEDALFDRIKKSGTTKFIKSLKEMNIDFIALEQQVFSLDMPLSLFPLFAPSAISQQDLELTKISKKLMSLLITLGDSPFIRYYDPEKRQGITYKLAQMVQNECDALSKADDSFPVKSDFRRTILVIVDRSFDMIAPFLQEFTYQAMYNDLLCGEKPKDAEVGGIMNPSYFVTPAAYLNLDEGDPIYLLIRHWHFAEAVDYILNSFSKFLLENKAASAALGSTVAPTGLDALKAMRDTLSSLPQFQTLKTKYSVHINICQDCKTLFERRNLDLVASVQQDLATGETSDGKTLKNAMLDLIPVLDNKKTSSYDKLRALIVYIIAMNGVGDMERKRLLETAKISADETQVITNLSLFDIILSTSQQKKEKDKRYAYWGSYKQERKKKKSKDNSLPYDLSRYVPLMKRILEDQVVNACPKETLPWVKEPKPEELGIESNSLKMFRFTSNGLVPPDPNYPHSLRTTRASWSGRGRSAKKDVQEKDKLDLRVNGARIILFSLGGLTHSEVRSVYEVSRDTQREIYIGGTFVYNPTQFIDLLKELHKSSLPSLSISPATADLPSEPEKKNGGLFGKRKV